MNFKNDQAFLELVSLHKQGLKLARGKGRKSQYQANITKQMNLEEHIMRNHEVSFAALNAAKVSA